MTQGFIVEMVSGSFPGASCFVCRVGSKWGRITARGDAHIFQSVLDAQRALNDMKWSTYFGPREKSRDLVQRIAAAKIRPVWV